MHIYPGIWSETDKILENQNFEKLKKKAHLEISFYHVEHK